MGLIGAGGANFTGGGGAGCLPPFLMTWVSEILSFGSGASWGFAFFGDFLVPAGAASPLSASLSSGASPSASASGEPSAAEPSSAAPPSSWAYAASPPHTNSAATVKQ